jgi:hypothetical protein
MKVVIALAIATFATYSYAEDKLPEPPDGYAWQKLSPIKSYVLKPDGWFFKESKKGETDGFFVTKEDINKAGSFKTGLTVNRIPDIPKKSGLKPSDYAAGLAVAAAAQHKLKDKGAWEKGPFKSVKFTFVDAPKDKESITIYHLTIANDKTGTLLLLIFEAPTKDWDEAWKKGETILKKLLLDDGV